MKKQQSRNNMKLLGVLKMVFHHRYLGMEYYLI